MVKILEIRDLTYDKFNNLNYCFNNGIMYSIIGSNNSGKTTLFYLLSGIILSDNCISCNNVLLSKQTRLQYIRNIGVVSKVSKNSFLFEKVIDEMRYPLINLGYSKIVINNRITEVIKLFKMESILNKKVNELSYIEKQVLLIMISILHKPHVLLLDNVLSCFNKRQKEEIIKILRDLSHDMTIINFTLSLNESLYFDQMLMLSDYQLKEIKQDDLFKNDKMFIDNSIEIPFVYDLSNKLKLYNLLDNDITDMKVMVDKIWPSS